MTDVFDQLNQGHFSPTLSFFSLKHTQTQDGTEHFELTFPPQSVNPMGLVQGGMIAAALDDATSVTMISGYQREFAPLSTDLHIMFHRGLQPGAARIEVKVVKLGQRSATAEGRLFDMQDRLIATLFHTAQPTPTASAS